MYGAVKIAAVSAALAAALVTATERSGPATRTMATVERFERGDFPTTPRTAPAFPDGCEDATLLMDVCGPSRSETRDDIGA